MSQRITIHVYPVNGGGARLVYTAGGRTYACFVHFAELTKGVLERLHAHPQVDVLEGETPDRDWGNVSVVPLEPFLFGMQLELGQTVFSDAERKELMAIKGAAAASPSPSSSAGPALSTEETKHMVEVIRSMKNDPPVDIRQLLSSLHNELDAALSSENHQRATQVVARIEHLRREYAVRLNTPDSALIYPERIEHLHQQLNTALDVGNHDEAQAIVTHLAWLRRVRQQ